MVHYRPVAKAEAGGKLPLCPHALLDSDLETVRLELDPDSLETELQEKISISFL